LNLSSNQFFFKRQLFLLENITAFIKFVFYGAKSLSAIFFKVENLMDRDLAPKIGDVASTTTKTFSGSLFTLGTNIVEKYKSCTNIELL
jgi:hypothetical protein